MYALRPVLHYSQLDPASSLESSPRFLASYSVITVFLCRSVEVVVIFERHGEYEADLTRMTIDQAVPGIERRRSRYCFFPLSSMIGLELRVMGICTSFCMKIEASSGRGRFDRPTGVSLFRYRD